MKFLQGGPFRLLLLLAAFLADQYTKWQARASFSLPDGRPDYFRVVDVLGEWLRFRLVYNEGAAFGLSPQKLLPFLHPTLFFTLVTLVAVAILTLYYRKLPRGDWGTRTGVTLILAGAMGNLADRMVLHRVTDFIDAGIPGVSPRWPTFNLADSWVCTGVVLILVLPLFQGRAAAGPQAAE